MKNNLSRTNLRTARAVVFSNPAAIRDNLPVILLPDDLASWLGRLALLYGVPFNYLVPDERMLPPESIRFFYLDPNWISSLCDGALSIGRNLTADDNSASFNLDKAVSPAAMEKLQTFKTMVRSKILGTTPRAVPQLITGFLLRSSLVLEYPSLGVNAYPLGGTPDDPNPVMLDILRMEQLSPTSDTLICLIAGNAYRVDIHEAPQALHYGIDCYNDNCTVNEQPVMAVKNLHTFTISSAPGPVPNTTVQTITMSTDETPVDISSSFRSNNTRVIDMTTLASKIATANSVTSIDSAEMGFEMTQGVGMVSFYKKQ
jgi:hypothetical protein